MNENIKRDAITDVVSGDQIIKGEWVRLGEEAMLIEQRFNPYTRRFTNYLNGEMVRDADEKMEGKVATIIVFSILGTLLCAILFWRVENLGTAAFENWVTMYHMNENIQKQNVVINQLSEHISKLNY